jgi:hypothetical protein
MHCCYRAGKFTMDGRGVDQPREPDNGAKHAGFCGGVLNVINSDETRSI